MKDDKGLREWMGIELELLVDRKIGWNTVFGYIKYGVKISDSEIIEIAINSTKEINGEQPDYWFVGNPNQRCKLVKILTAEIKKWDGVSVWKQDTLEGDADYYGEVTKYITHKDV